MEIFRHFVEFKKPWLAIFALGLFAITLSNLFTFFISPLMIAVVFGILMANLSPKSARYLRETMVINFASKQILRLGIILFGFKISFADVQFVGISGVCLAIFVVCSTFFLGIFIGKLLGLDYKFSALISSGSAVCGAAAVMATQSVLNEEPNKVAIAICTVVVFGTLGMILYPFLFEIINFDLNKTGTFLGASLHEVAHVVAASGVFGDVASKNAVIIKMLRVLMLIPLLIGLSIVGAKGGSGSSKHFPFFAVIFLIVVILNSLLDLPSFILAYIGYIDTLLLSVAMVALGLGIRKDIFKNVGFKPFLLAFILFCYLAISCFLIVDFII